MARFSRSDTPDFSPLSHSEIDRIKPDLTWPSPAQPGPAQPGPVWSGLDWTGTLLLKTSP